MNQLALAVTLFDWLFLSQFKGKPDFCRFLYTFV